MPESALPVGNKECKSATEPAFPPAFGVPMNLVLLKIFATALAIGQAAIRPDAVRTEFDAVSDRTEVVQILRDSCTHLRKAFGVEAIDIDDLLDTAMADPKAVGEARLFRGIDLSEVQKA